MDAQQEHPNPRRLVTVPRTAELLAVSPRLIWRLIASGDLEVVRLGRATRVKLESIDRLIERGGVA
ncbi:MAG: helix-turn-helix domain-containing protein [Candidatus Eisenbacteria bacterium]|nr:helix-turn-helix domain-containing protein [Candidatus Eisenbacteria bacterium]